MVNKWAITSSTSVSSWAFDDHDDLLCCCVCFSETELANKHVYISYPPASSESALRIRDKLKEAGFKVWIDIDDMRMYAHAHLSSCCVQQSFRADPTTNTAVCSGSWKTMLVIEWRSVRVVIIRSAKSIVVVAGSDGRMSWQWQPNVPQQQTDNVHRAWQVNMKTWVAETRLTVCTLGITCLSVCLSVCMCVVFVGGIFIVDALAASVQQAGAVLLCMSSNYQQSHAAKAGNWFTFSLNNTQLSQPIHHSFIDWSIELIHYITVVVIILYTHNISAILAQIVSNSKLSGTSGRISNLTRVIFK